MNLGYHHACVADARRVEALQRALRSTIEPGCIAADLGCGTGVLACLAVKAGAARCHAVELGSSIELARELAAANGIADRVILHQADARTLQLEERVDVVVGDVLGVLGVEDSVTRIYADFCRNNLAEEGAVIPNRLEVFAAPVAHPSPPLPAEFWRAERYGLDLSPMLRVAANWPHSTELDPQWLISAGQRVFDLALGRDGTGALAATLRFSAQPGEFNGLAVWFRAHLPDEVLSTAPGDPPMVWRQGFLPVDPPCAVNEGDDVRVELTATPESLRTAMGWNVAVVREGVEIAHRRHHQFFSRTFDLR